MTDRFEALLETIAGVAAANVVVIETLHEHKVLDRMHFAHAFARALDTLSPEFRGGMVESTLRNMQDRCMNLEPGAGSSAREWLRAVLGQRPPAGGA
jgi:hypothetical protein